MLEIRTNQLAILARHAEDPLVEWLRTYLRQRWPRRAHALSDDELAARARFGLARAHEHGLTDAGSRARFVETMFVVGPRFDEHPEVRRLLESATTLPPETRMDHVLTYLSAETIEEIRAEPEADAWPSAADP